MTDSEPLPTSLPPITVAETSWRERAVERSLTTARAKASERSDRFLAAAAELLNETGRPDFTVQQLVERTRMSLRSFYQHFASKDELLLMLFQEALRAAADGWRLVVEESDTPMHKMRALVETVYSAPLSAVGVTDGPSMHALAVYHLQLADQSPQDFALIVVPLKELLLSIVEAGVATGDFRSDLGAEPLAVLVLQSLITSTILSLLNDHLMDAQIGPDVLWSFLAAALRSPDPQHQT